jgi:hypothetical protein
MRSRSIRSRNTFQLESLETRNAPSHFGGLAHAAMVIHRAHAPAAAQVRHFSDPQGTDRNGQQETSSVDQSRDHGVETSSNDPSSNDPSSLDPKADR